MQLSIHFHRYNFGVTAFRCAAHSFLTFQMSSIRTHFLHWCFVQSQPNCSLKLTRPSPLKHLPTVDRHRRMRS